MRCFMNAIKIFCNLLSRVETNLSNAYFSTLLLFTARFCQQHKNAGASIFDGFSFDSQSSKQRSGVCISTPQKDCEQ